MIVIEKVRFKNFLATGRTFIEIDIASYKTTLCVGLNGAGKSTMLDALSFTLFNRPFREVNKGQVLNTITKKECVTEVELSINGKHYLVRRGIKPNVFQIFIDGTEVPPMASATDFQTYLEDQILKMNFKSFIQVVMLGSALFVPFMKLKAAQRREVVEDLLDLQVFSQMNQLLKGESASITEGITEVLHHRALAEQSIQTYEKILASQKQSRQEEIKNYEVELAEIDQQISTIHAEMMELLKRSTDLLAVLPDRKPIDLKNTKLTEMSIAASQQIAGLDADLNFFDKNHECPECKQYIDVKHRNEIVSEKIEARNKLYQALATINAKRAAGFETIEAIETQQEQINRLQRDASDKQTTISHKHISYRRVQLKIEELNKPIVVPDFDIDHARNELKKIDAELNQLQHQARVHKYVGTLLKDSGIKAQVIKQYVPVFNELINKYLTALDFFVDFHLDENFNETIRSRHRDGFSYNLFSEGQKMRIDLALMFTWRAIARQRNSININVLILDEVLDSSLDYVGTEDFLALIKKLTSDDNVVVISHRGPAIHDQFDRVLEFELVKNFTQMKVAS